MLIQSKIYLAEIHFVVLYMLAFKGLNKIFFQKIMFPKLHIFWPEKYIHGDIFIYQSKFYPTPTAIQLVKNGTLAVIRN